MKLTRLFAGVALAAAALSANAEDIVRNFNITLDDNNYTFGDTFAAGNANKTFLDTFNFTIGGSSVVGSSLTSRMTVNRDLNISSFDLYSGSNLIAKGTMLSTGLLEQWTLDAIAPAQGAYSLRVGGRVIGGLGVSFAGDAYVTPVPEPETWVMLVGGLAVLGLAARRRKSGGMGVGGMAA